VIGSELGLGIMGRLKISLTLTLTLTLILTLTLDSIITINASAWV
jgi:hypothetical protein